MHPDLPASRPRRFFRPEEIFWTVAFANPHAATTGRHTLHGLNPADTACATLRNGRRFSGRILRALRQVAWHTDSVVGVPT